MADQTVSSLSFVVENQTYFYNRELGKEADNNLQAEGFTLTGNLAKPYFRYQVSEHLQIQAGVLWNAGFGDDNQPDEVDPVIALHYDFSPGWRITAGTIDRNHPLHDAIFNDELRYREPVEQGFQLKADTSYLRQDLWISWEERETATQREKFSIGDYSQLKAWGLMLEAQVYWVHLGGQQNSGPGVFNNLSYGAGTGYTYRPAPSGSNEGGASGWLDEIGFTVHYLKNIDSPPSAPEVDDEGMAYRGFITLWDTYLYYQHWRGGSLDFNSPRGDSVLGNVALSKGDPMYRARIYDEVGIVKSWKLAEEVMATVDLRAQFAFGQFEPIAILNFTWRPEFPLFQDYFRGQTPLKPEAIEPPIGRPYRF